FSSRRRHTISTRDWSSDVCSSDLHFDRGEAEGDHRIAQLLAAEDVQLGHILAARSGKGFGMSSIYSESIYSMVSGREATSAGLRSEERRVGKECRSRWALARCR